MSGLGNDNATGVTSGNWNTGGSGANGFSSQDARSGGDGFGVDAGEGTGAADNNNCRNCGQEGHFARECPEPRKSSGACFNCGEEGHSKADCPKPRAFKGDCRLCNQPGHPAAECPDRKIVCKNCLQEGHETLGCENTKVMDMSRIPDKTVDEAWIMLKEASDDRDIGEFKEAVQILSKALPGLTYPQLEKEMRERKFNIYLIAMEKEHGDTYTVVDMQGGIEKKYCVFYFLSDKPQRPSMKERWPESADDNLERLADAGIAVDRGVPKCHNCDKLGHTSKSCPEERVTIERTTIACALCGEEGHRVRDCTQERQKPREPRTCKNCGSEDHIAKECDQPRNPDTIQCRNCDQMGHTSRDCPAPKDWSRVKCTRCEQMGHGAKRCKEPVKEGDDGFGEGDNSFGGREDNGFGNPDGFASGSGGGNWNDIGAAEGTERNPAPAAGTAEVGKADPLTRRGTQIHFSTAAW